MARALGKCIPCGEWLFRVTEQPDSAICNNFARDAITMCSFNKLLHNIDFGVDLSWWYDHLGGKRRSACVYLTCRECSDTFHSFMTEKTKSSSH